MRRFLAGALATTIAACATAPLAPDPSVDLTGRWTIVAVDGEPTGDGPRFRFELGPTTGSAQFGCNAGGGRYTVSNGWLVGPQSWIITAARCLKPERWLKFEHKGFHILAKPLAIERRRDGVRLRNQLGTIDLRRAP